MRHSGIYEIIVMRKINLSEVKNENVSMICKLIIAGLAAGSIGLAANYGIANADTTSASATATTTTAATSAATPASTTTSSSTTAGSSNIEKLPSTVKTPSDADFANAKSDMDVDYVGLPTWRQVGNIEATDLKDGAEAKAADAKLAADQAAAKKSPAKASQTSASTAPAKAVPKQTSTASSATPFKVFPQTGNKLGIGLTVLGSILAVFATALSVIKIRGIEFFKKVL